MTYISLEAPERLSGEIWLQGSKNAVLPILAATILCKGTTVLHNCPDIQDVGEMLDLLQAMGCKCQKKHHDIEIDGRAVIYKDNFFARISNEKMKKTRASIILLGAMLGRFQEARITYPGGCKIGERKIDIHLELFRQLGYEVAEQKEGVFAKGRIKQDVQVLLPFASVGATENAILASVISDGYIVNLEHVAREPEIIELCDCLKKMGADISGAGSDCICIKGVQYLHECEYEVGSDRIVAGTYGAALLAAGGNITMKGIRPDIDKCVLDIFHYFGMECQLKKDYMNLRFLEKKNWKKEGHFIISTAPYPGFPTDLQSQMMAVLCCHVDTGIIVENLFENRLRTAEMLNRMGAEIEILNDRVAMLTGVSGLKGCQVEAYDLRGGAALLIAGLMAEGKTDIFGVPYIQRGYEDICRDFSDFGVRIKEWNLN